MRPIAADAVVTAADYAEAEADRPAFWARQARELLAWSKDFDEAMGWSNPPFAEQVSGPMTYAPSPDAALPAEETTAPNALGGTTLPTQVKIYKARSASGYCKPELNDSKATRRSTAMAKIILSVEDAASRDQQIEHSCSRLRSDAIDCGILVTRVDYALFEIALSPDVPFGVTDEMDLL